MSVPHCFHMVAGLGLQAGAAGRLASGVLTLALVACASDPGGPVDASIHISARSHDFGSVQLGGRSAELALTVANGGEGVTGRLSVQLSGPAAGEFRLSSDQCSSRTLAESETCGLRVSMIPTTEGAKEVVLTIEDPTGGDASATLRGRGGGPKLTVDQSNHDFGDAAVGAMGTSFLFVVRNAGVAPTGPLVTKRSGPAATDFEIVGDNCAGASLGLAGSCGVIVRFAPATLGARTATLSVATVAGDTVSAVLTGTSGVATQLEPDPRSHDFGAFGPTAGLQQASIVLRNVGSQTSGRLAARFNSPVSERLSIGGGSCIGYQLAPGAGCTMTIYYHPGHPGAMGATETELAVSDVFGTEITIALRGATSGSRLEIAPSQLDFGSVAVGGVSAPRLVTVTNHGNEPTTPLETSLAWCDLWDCWPGTVDFRISSDHCAGAILAPGANCNITVTFTPTTLGGPLNGSLMVTEHGVITSSNLAGAGTSP